VAVTAGGTLRRLATPRVALAAAIAAYAAVFATLSVLRYRAFHTGRFDLGNMTQAVWATAHGHPLLVTSVNGQQFVRLGAHADPILVLFAPLWWLWPSPELLLVAQAVAIALGAVPLYAIARRHLRSERAALGFAAAYLLYPPVQWLTLNEFHPVALACPLLIAAFWALDRERLVLFGVFAVLAAATKEEVALVVAFIGLWYAIRHRRRLTGAAIAIVAVAWALVALEVVIPHWSPTGASAFTGRYRAVGGSPAGIAKTSLLHPLRVLGTAFQRRDVAYLLQLAVPLGLLFALSPLVALAALPELALNVLSSVGTQSSIRFHYSAALLPPLLVASVFGAARLADRRRIAPERIALALVLLCLASNYRLGPLPLWRGLPFASQAQTDWQDVTAHDRIAARALRLVPPNAVVSATNSLGAHLSARRRILSFPLLADATWVAVDSTVPSYLDSTTKKREGREAIARIRRDPRWRTVFARDGVAILRRR
jgi:uncharacterized membrane protein